jgi:hypothetical protein
MRVAVRLKLRAGNTFARLARSGARPQPNFTTLLSAPRTSGREASARSLCSASSSAGHSPQHGTRRRGAFAGARQWQARGARCRGVALVEALVPFAGAAGSCLLGGQAVYRSLRR